MSSFWQIGKIRLIRRVAGELVESECDCSVPGFTDKKGYKQAVLVGKQGSFLRNKGNQGGSKLKGY